MAKLKVAHIHKKFASQLIPNTCNDYNYCIILNNSTPIDINAIQLLKHYSNGSFLINPPPSSIRRLYALMNLFISTSVIFITE